MDSLFATIVRRRHECVTDTLADVHSPAIRVVEKDTVPGTERRRADPYIHNPVEHGASDARDEFRLSWRDIGEVDAADHPRPRSSPCRLGAISKASLMARGRISTMLPQSLERCVAVYHGTLAEPDARFTAMHVPLFDHRR